MLKKTLCFALCLVQLLMVSACGNGRSTSIGAANTGSGGSGASGDSGQTYNLRFAVEDYKSEFTYEYACKVKEEVEANSNGRISVTIYPEGQLSSGADQVELLQTNACELALIYTVSVATVIPEANLFSLHYLFPNDLRIADQILNEGEAVKRLTEVYANHGLQTLDFFTRAQNCWTANKEIHSPADMSGFKIRTTATPILTKAYELYGANPTATSYSELYSALQLKMVDGQTNPLVTIDATKYYEVQDYVIMPYAENMVLTFNANKEFWDSLSAEDQQIIMDAVDVANSEIYENRAAGVEASRKTIEDYGTTIIELTEDEQNAFRELATKNHATFVKLAGDSGQELLDLFLADVEKFSK